MPNWSLHQRPLIKSAMTPFPHSIAIEAPLEQAIGMMSEHNIRHLPVKDGSQLVGIVTDRDVRMVLDTRIGPRWERELQVRDACIPDAYTVDLNTPLDVVLLEMVENNVSSALVLKDDKLAGIFTAHDACRTFGDFLSWLYPEGGDEAA